MPDRTSPQTEPSDGSRAASPKASANEQQAGVALTARQGDVGGVATHAHRGHIYPATVTAHFGDQGTLLQAREALAKLGLSPGAHKIQWIEKAAQADPWGDQQPGLADGMTVLIIQLADATRGPEVVRLCEEAGAQGARFYEKQQITW